MTIQDMVREMCTAFWQDVHDELHKPDDFVRGSRLKMLSEEFREYMEAEKLGDPTNICKEAADMVIVIYGTIAAAYGVDLDKVIREVMASNMTKVKPDGTVIKNEWGKVQKPEGYRPPDLAPILGDLSAWQS